MKKIRILVAKPGLDGHDRGAKVIAKFLQENGYEVVYTGLHQTPEQIVNAALQEAVDGIGISVLSGSHVTLVEEVIARLKQAGLGHVPVVVGGIIPAEDEAQLKAAGVARVYTPKDFDLTQIMRAIVAVVDRTHTSAA